MTATSAHRRPAHAGATAGRIHALLAVDGPVATTVLTVFQYFVLSVSFLACLVPAIVFAVLVGVQSTHLALWLGALSLVPVVPALYGLLRGARRLLAERAAARAGREFWRSFARGWRVLSWAAASFSGVALLLGYDVALFRSSDAVLLLAAGAAAVALVLTVGICAVAAARDTRGAIVLTTLAVKGVTLRPHIGLSWLALLVLGPAATTLPLVGPVLALFLPALFGVAVHICNDALRLSLTDETRQTP